MAPAVQDGVTRPTDKDPASFPDPLKTLIWNAVLEKATDIHLHSVADGLRVLYRVDGMIHPKQVLPRAEGRRLLNQLKSAAGLTIVRVVFSSRRPARLAG